MPIIKVSNFKKYFKTYKKQPGFTGSVKSLFKRKYQTVKAVDNISFNIHKEELVGFIGQNGAGKTTTLKCLSGLLYPTSGQISVLGSIPFDRKKKFLKNIALVMGNKNQLWWDLPPIESFYLYKEIYEIENQSFKKNLSELTDLLQVKNILKIQVRKLSLGQRMKCELIAALLHKPQVLFLDEPTIGLDVIMQKNLRDFIKSYNKNFKTTIILTSHYMEDVKKLAKRVIIINLGKIIYDGDLQTIIDKYARNKLITIILKKPVEKDKLSLIGKIKYYEKTKVVIAVSKNQAKQQSIALLKNFPIQDINIEDPKIETIIRNVFNESNRK